MRVLIVKTSKHRIVYRAVHLLLDMLKATGLSTVTVCSMVTQVLNQLSVCGMSFIKDSMARHLPRRTRRLINTFI